MASFLDKVQTLVKADLNRMVDRALTSNEPAVFQHHIRDLQTMQEQLEHQMVNLRAEITEMRRRSDEQQALVVQQDLEVDAFLRENQQDEALAAQERLNQSRLNAAKQSERLERMEAEYAQLTDTKTQLDARIEALVRSEPEVDGLVNLARAKQHTADAMQSLDDLQGAGDPDTARVVNSIRSRLAEAEAQIAELEKRGLARGETPEVLKRKELEAQLEARKTRLGL